VQWRRSRLFSRGVRVVGQVFKPVKKSLWDKERDMGKLFKHGEYSKILGNSILWNKHEWGGIVSPIEGIGSADLRSANLMGEGGGRGQSLKRLFHSRKASSKLG